MIFVIWKFISKIISLLISSLLWTGSHRMSSTFLRDSLSIWKNQVLYRLGYLSLVYDLGHTNLILHPFRRLIINIENVYQPLAKCKPAGQTPLRAILRDWMLRTQKRFPWNLLALLLCNKMHSLLEVVGLGFLMVNISLN